MTTEPVSVEVRFTQTFRKNVKCLYKKHPSIRQDIDLLIQTLQRGETPGNRIHGTDTYIIYKTRLKISGSEKGKSGGYRVIFWLRSASFIVLLVIYAKSEQTDIATDEIRRIVTDYATTHHAGPK